MKGVVFDPAARVEFLAAVAYYEECVVGLGQSFRIATEKEAASIEFMPFRFRMLHVPFRRCLIPQFPYSLIFSIEPDFILIIAVAHTKRKPGYWNDRINKYH